MTGHMPAPCLRAASARLVGDTLRAVAIAYRPRRQEGASDRPAYEAAVAELHGRVPHLTDQAATSRSIGSRTRSAGSRAHGAR
jgi:hypothetical protein